MSILLAQACHFFLCRFASKLAIEMLAKPAQVTVWQENHQHQAERQLASQLSCLLRAAHQPTTTARFGASVVHVVQQAVVYAFRSYSAGQLSSYPARCFLFICCRLFSQLVVACRRIFRNCTHFWQVVRWLPHLQLIAIFTLFASFFYFYYGNQL